MLRGLHRGDIPEIGDGLTALPPGQAITSVAILAVTWWQRQQGWAGLASDTEYQPSPLAHIQPSALISRYVLTIALMCLLSGEASKPALFVRCPSSQSSLAFPLPREHWSWNQPEYCHSPGMAEWLKAHRLPDSALHELGNVEDVDKQFPKPIILHKAHWD